jgi:cytoskeletal protein CcmA (bactofilin family)
MQIDFMKRQNRHGLRPEPNEDFVALLEPGIQMEGQIKVTSGMIRLNSRFKGTVSSEGTVIVASEADIEGDIAATQISIAGKVKGNIRATRQLEITEHGILLGNVETPSIKIDAGAYFTGHCNMPTHTVEKSAMKEVVSAPERA